MTIQIHLKLNNKNIKEFLKQQLNIAKSNPDNFLFLSRNLTLVAPGTINKILQKTMTNLGTKNHLTCFKGYKTFGPQKRLLPRGPEKV